MSANQVKFGTAGKRATEAEDQAMGQHHKHPMVLVSILQESIKFFSDYANPAAKQRGFQTIPNLMCQLAWENLSVGKVTGAISYSSVFSSNMFTVCLFILKKGATMPIHNHPNMTVFSRVIHGSILAKTFTTGPQRRIGNVDLFHIENSTAKVINSSSGLESVLIIDDGQEPNLHSFRAESDLAAFLDIIGPPYDDTNRVCSYYAEMPQSEIDGVEELKSLNTGKHGFLRLDPDATAHYNPSPVTVTYNVENQHLG